MRCPLEAHRASEGVRAQRVAHRVDKALAAARREAVLPPEAEHLDLAGSAVDARLDPAHEAIAEEHRQHVPTPATLGRREEQLPHVLERKRRPRRLRSRTNRSDRGEGGATRGGGSRRSSQQLDLLAEDEAPAAHVLHLDGNELPALDELLAQ